MNETDELLSKLANLWKKVRAAIQVGTIESEIVSYKKFEVTEFDYKDGVPARSRDLRLDRTDLTFDGMDQLSAWLKQREDYREVSRDVSIRCKTDEDRGLSLVDQLMHNIPIDCEGKEGIKEYIARFLRVWEELVVDWAPKVWIEGILLECDDPQNCRFAIGDELVIRKPLPSDFEYAVPDYDRSSDHDILLNYQGSDAILELSYASKVSDKGPMDAQVMNEVDNLINCLRLFKLGSINLFYIEYDQLTKNLLLIGNRVDRTAAAKSLYKYVLGKEDKDRLTDFVKQVKALFPTTESLSEAENKKRNPDRPLHIALQRYYDSLSDMEGVDHQISSAVTCLEALYLTGEAELSYRLQLRVAGLLRFARFDDPTTPSDIREDVKIAYGIRSSFAHGSFIEEKNLKKSSDLARKVVDYARRSLLLFLQLKRLIDEDKKYLSDDGLKTDIINMIDDSLVDLSAYDNLENLVRTHCHFLE